MSFKSAMAAATLTALASMFTVIGCGGDECVKAADHLDECVPFGSSNTTTGSGTTTGDTGLETGGSCDGLKLCLSQCVNEAGCPTLKAMSSGNDDPGLKAYLDCLDKCNTMAN